MYRSDRTPVLSVRNFFHRSFQRPIRGSVSRLSSCPDVSQVFASGSGCCRRLHSAFASFNWITKHSRGGFPRFAYGEHIYFASFPNARSCASLIFWRRSRSSVSSTSSGFNPIPCIPTSPHAKPSRIAELSRGRARRNDCCNKRRASRLSARWAAGT